MVAAYPPMSATLGFEESTRATLKVLIDGLNDEIEARSARWSQADLDWQEFAGTGIGQVDIPLVPIDHFHEGPHPSIIEAPIESFPAVAVTSFFTTSGTREIDGSYRSSLRLAIEMFSISGPVYDQSMIEHSTIVGRRIQRTVEAANAVLMRNRTLCGAAQPGITDLPRGGIGPQRFARKEENGTGPRWVWQGARIEYTLQRNSMF